MATSIEQSLVATMNQKRITTYGKGPRKRMPEVFAKLPTIPQRPKTQAIAEPIAAQSSASDKTNKPKILPHASPPKRTRPSPPKSAFDIFDVSESDEERDMRLSDRSPTPGEKVKPKTLKRASTSRNTSPPSKSTPMSNTFDAPMSDGEDQETSRPAKKIGKLRKDNNGTMGPRKGLVQKDGHGPLKTASSNISDAAIVDAKPKSRQRSAEGQVQVDKSPIRKKSPAMRAKSVEAKAQLVPAVRGGLKKASGPLVATKPSRKREKSASPQTLGPYRVQKRQPTPPKLASKLTSVPQTPSPSLKSPSSGSHSPGARFLSPRGRQIWEDLLESVNVDKLPEVNGLQEGIDTVTKNVTARTLFKPAGVSKPSHKARAPPRRRIIDALVEQSLRTAVEEESSSSESDDGSRMERIMTDKDVAVVATREESTIHESQHSAAFVAATQSSQNGMLKKTYERQRSFLPEEDLMKELEVGLSSQPTRPGRTRRVSIPVLKPLLSLKEETDEVITGTAILSVHELRQAGANSRFSDEVRDLLDRIGTPASTSPSMRRSGLLDLADKMKDKNFAKQFRAEGCAEKLFLHLGQESDIIAGFIMVSLLIAVLQEGSMPHIVAHLRRHGIARLLIRLLSVRVGIVAVGKERKSNMSKAAHSLLSEHHQYLLGSSIWDMLQPTIIPPRTLALKCLETLVRQTRKAGIAGEIMSKELTTNLFDILRTASNEEAWSLPTGQVAVDFFLALSILESHSIAARTAQDETIWISDYLPIIADSLQAALCRPAHEFGQLQLLFLRLTLNVTNNNAKASDVFAREDLMTTMGQVVITLFARMSQVMSEEELQKALDSLVLVLGVMINFAEWSFAARNSLQNLEGKVVDPLTEMIQIFVDNQERTAEVCSTILASSISLLIQIGCINGRRPEEHPVRLSFGTTRLPFASALHCGSSATLAAGQDS